MISLGKPALTDRVEGLPETKLSEKNPRLLGADFTLLCTCDFPKVPCDFFESLQCSHLLFFLFVTYNLDAS